MNVAARARFSGIVVAGIVVAGATAVLTAPARADTDPPAGLPATVSADALPTVQINGVVWSEAIAGDTVFAGGKFSKARPAGVSAGGAGEASASNFVAYDVTSGVRRTGAFVHNTNAQVMAVAASPDQKTVYIGGDFTTVDGQSRNHIAALDATTGALLDSFRPSINGQVRAITVSSSVVYAGGSFSKANNATRTRLAAFNPANGALTSWAPSADNGQVQGMAVTQDGSRVVIGGRFTTLNHVAANGMGAVSTATGATGQWLANQTIRNGGSKCGITSITAGDSLIFGSGFAFGCGNFEGTFGADPATGKIVFVNDCHGDTYDTWSRGQVLYSVSHAHDCKPIGALPTSHPWSINMRHALAYSTFPTCVNTGPDVYGWNYKGIPCSAMLQWFPELKNGSFTGQTQAAWNVSGNDSYVVLGGEFPKINGKNQQGLVRLAVRAIAPNKMGPVRAPEAPTPTAATVSNSSVKVSWQSAYDMDNAALTYRVYRSGNATPVQTVTRNSVYWNYPMQSFTDTGVPPGTYTYSVKVSDPLGNTITLPATNSVSVAGGAAALAPKLAPGGATTSSTPDGTAPNTAPDGTTPNTAPDGTTPNGTPTGTTPAPPAP